MKKYARDLKKSIQEGSKPYYMQNEDGMRIYLLPGVPMGAEFPCEPKCDFDAILSLAKKKLPRKNAVGMEKRLEKIVQDFKGRTLDAASVLFYALEQGRFEEIAQRLEEGYKKFSYIPSKLRWARTDVTAFFMQLYLDLGAPNKERAMNTIRFDKKYGPGILIFPESVKE